MTRQIELLAPAGTFEALTHACAFGADAVYAGMPRYSLRVRNNDFKNVERLKAGINHMHSHGKKFFLALNVMPHGNKVKSFLNDLAPIVECKPDALIMADPGLILMVRETWPDMPIHLSVQANTMNSASVKFWQRQGISRVILSRELSLKEVAEIRQDCPDMELEVFVHGALCIAYSGRCLLSGYFNHRDANQGTCTNACRWQYGLTDTKETPEGEVVPHFADMDTLYSRDSTTLIKPSASSGGGCSSCEPKGKEADYTPHPDAEKSYLLQEMKLRQGEWMEISEDENGTYIMNSRDLRAIQHVQKLVEIGIDSLKIEGRTKSAYYVARTSQLYRQAIDDAVAGRDFSPELYGKLEGLANRGYTDGFLQRHVPDAYQNYLSASSVHYRQQFVAQVLEYDAATGLSRLDVRNHFASGDRVEVISPNGNRDMVLGEMKTTRGETIPVAKGSGYVVLADIGPTTPMTMVARYLETPIAT